MGRELLQGWERLAPHIPAAFLTGDGSLLKSCSLLARRPGKPPNQQAEAQDKGFERRFRGNPRSGLHRRALKTLRRGLSLDTANHRQPSLGTAATRREDLFQEVQSAFVREPLRRTIPRLFVSQNLCHADLEVHVYRVPEAKDPFECGGPRIGGPSDNRPGPEQTLASAEWTREASAALARLPASCRELFELIFVEHLPYDEIAEKLGVAEGTVKSRTWRCREQLANLLKEKGIALSS